jgi:hypothetical protein
MVSSLFVLRTVFKCSVRRIKSVDQCHWIIPFLIPKYSVSFARRHVLAFQLYIFCEEYYFIINPINSVHSAIQLWGHSQIFLIIYPRHTQVFLLALTSLLLLLLLLVLFIITIMRNIYNYTSETNHVIRVHRLQLFGIYSSWHIQNFIFRLTFVGPCIVIYFYSKTNQMHNISNLFYFGTTHYMFRTVSPSIISSLRLHTQHHTIQVLWLLASKQPQSIY